MSKQTMTGILYEKLHKQSEIFVVEAKDFKMDVGIWSRIKYLRALLDEMEQTIDEISEERNRK